MASGSGRNKVRVFLGRDLSMFMSRDTKTAKNEKYQPVFSNLAGTM